MLEVAYVPSRGGAVLRPAPEPPAPGPGEVLVRARRVGFCGTDREIVRGGVAVLPEGADSLVLGHEMVGEVVEAGEGALFRPGQLVVGVVRRPCTRCAPCARGRPDFCLSGEYLEYGITRLDGFARTAFVLPAASLVPVPEGVGPLAVLAEPLSVVEKAVEQARTALARVPGLELPEATWGQGRLALVAGAGPIGVLATFVLARRGFQVTTVDRKPEGSLSAQLVALAGARYVRAGSGLGAAGLEADVAVEATGDPQLAFELLWTLRPAGVLVWVGFHGKERAVSVDGGRLVLRAVLHQNAVVATVNAAREHFEGALADLSAFVTIPGFSRIVTAVLPPERFEEALWPSGEAVKQVVGFDGV